VRTLLSPLGKQNARVILLTLCGERGQRGNVKMNVGQSGLTLANGKSYETELGRSVDRKGKKMAKISRKSDI